MTHNPDAEQAIADIYGALRSLQKAIAEHTGELDSVVSVKLTPKAFYAVRHHGTHIAATPCAVGRTMLGGIELEADI